MAVRKEEKYLATPLAEIIQCFVDVNTRDHLSCFWLYNAGTNKIVKLTGRVFYGINSPTNFSKTFDVPEENKANILDDDLLNINFLSKKKKKYYYPERIYYEADVFENVGLTAGGVLPINRMDEMVDLTHGPQETAGTLVTALRSFQGADTLMTDFIGGANIKIGVKGIFDNKYVNKCINQHYLNFNKTHNVLNMPNSSSTISKDILIDFDDFKTHIIFEKDVKKLVDTLILKTNVTPSVLCQIGNNPTSIEFIYSNNTNKFYVDRGVNFNGQWRVSFLTHAKEKYLGDVVDGTPVVDRIATGDGYIDALDLTTIYGNLNAGGITADITNIHTTECFVSTIYKYIFYFVEKFKTNVLDLKKFLMEIQSLSIAQLLVGTVVPGTEINSTNLLKAWSALSNTNTFVYKDIPYSLEKFISVYNLYYYTIFLLKDRSIHAGAGATNVFLFQDCIDQANYNVGSAHILKLESFVKTMALFRVVNTAAAKLISTITTNSTIVLNSLGIFEMLNRAETDFAAWSILNNVNTGSLLNNIFNGNAGAATARGGSAVNEVVSQVASPNMILTCLDSLTDTSYTFGKYTFLFEKILNIYENKGGADHQKFLTKCLIQKSNILFD